MTATLRRASPVADPLPPQPEFHPLTRAAARRDSTLLVLAPHYDDAVFSCGAIVHQHTSGGGRAIVATVFGGPPGTADNAGSPMARILHARWRAALEASGAFGTSSGPQPETDDLTIARAMVARRRAEDAEAVALLQAEAVALPFADCIYRRLPDGQWRCASEAALFTGNGSVEPALEAAVSERLSDLMAELGKEGPAGVAITVLAPLGLGNHIDHRLVREAAERTVGRGLCYYEDIPYALEGAAWSAFVPSGLRGAARPVALENVEAKIAAAARYSSQLSTFWPDALAMAEALRAFAGQRGAPGGFAEVLWQRASTHDRYSHSCRAAPVISGCDARPALAHRRKRTQKFRRAQLRRTSNASTNP